MVNERRGQARRLSGRMVIAITAIMVLVGLTVAAVALFAVSDSQWLAGLLAEKFGGRRLPLGRTGAVFIVATIVLQAAIFFYALNALRQAFAIMSRSDLADGGAGRNLGIAGIAFLINTAVMMIMPPVTSLIYSAGAPKGSGFVTVQFGTGELLSLLLSAILIVTGRLMALAAEIDDENRQIV